MSSRSRLERTALIALGVAWCLHGQPQNTVSALSPSTPPGMASGAALGSYSLSGLEHINLYSGRLSVFLPLRQVDGRGEADFTIGLAIDKQWYVQRNTVTNVLQATTLSLPVGYFAGYSPGIMYLRQVGSGGPVLCDGLPRYVKNVTRLTFRNADGSEIEFRDALTQGKPLDVVCGSGALRVSTFVSGDGSAASFVSDSPIFDAPLVTDGTLNHTFIVGTIFWRDGRRYRIGGGVVRSITDRNGNTTTLNYESANYIFDDGGTGSGLRIVSATDSMNRSTTITYSDTNGTNPPHDQIIFKGFGGAQRILRVYRPRLSQTGVQVFPTRTLFPQLPGSSQFNFDPLVAAAVELPNGQRYTFSYNTYGELRRMVLPTGGAFEYDFADVPTGNISVIHRRLVERRLYANGSTLTGRTTYAGGFGTNSTICTETVYDNSNASLKVVLHNYTGNALDPNSTSPNFTNFGYAPWTDGLESITDIQGTTDFTTRLRRIYHTWEQRETPPWWTDAASAAPANDVRLTQLTTELENGEVAREHYSYDRYNNRTHEWVYGYEQGGQQAVPIRHIERAFVTSNDILGSSVDYTAAPIHLRSLPLYEVIYRLDPLTGLDINELSLTRFYYDDAGVQGVNNIVGMDPAFGTSYWTRGNLTRIDKMLGQQAIISHQAFDVAGNIIQVSLPDLHLTFFEYADRFGSPDGQMNDAFTPPELAGGVAAGFYTRMLNMVGHSQYMQWDYYTGSIVDQSDANGVIKATFRNDVLDRVTQIVRANNSTSRGQTAIAYNDSEHTITTTSDQRSLNDNRLRSSLIYDGLGQPIQRNQLEDGGVAITIDEQYDALGRNTRTSNPHRPTDSIVWTSRIFDALDRVSQITYPDGAVAAMSFAGDETTTTDPAQKATRHRYDPLGRVIRVQEDPFGLNYTTTYSHDPRGMLTKVIQGTQTRTFNYDGLGRLTSAIVPESGPGTYTYDNNNNILTRTDARGATATFTYDLINRVKSASYSDSTATVTYTYDDSAVPNAIGRLTAVSSEISTSFIQGYDALGDVSRSAQVTNGQTYSFSYTYDLSGALVAETYPSGRVVSNSYDSAGRVNGLSSTVSSESRSYASGIQYTAHGAVQLLPLGNGLRETTTFNSRFQPLQISSGTSGNSTSVLALSYTYTSGSGQNNNGNVLTQTITIPGTGALMQTYLYDGINRLMQATETVGASQSWVQSYDYDAYGNRAVRSSSSYIPAPAFTPQSLTAFDIVSNHWIGGSYDAAGNMISDNFRSFAYDAENRQSSATVPSNGPATTYAYDGHGHRIKKMSGTATTVYVYDVFQRLVGEYSTQSPVLAGTTFLSTDHLGNIRAVTDGNGSVKSRHDYLPFGEEIEPFVGNRAAVPGYAAPDGITQRFTGKERDSETGLDYFLARHYYSAQGRFTSADAKIIPSRLADPQSVNRYTSTRNNPLTLIDPDGRDWVSAFIASNRYNPLQLLYGHAVSDITTGIRQHDGLAIASGVAETVRNTAGVIVGGASIGMGAGYVATNPTVISAASNALTRQGAIRVGVGAALNVSTTYFTAKVEGRSVSGMEYLYSGATGAATGAFEINSSLLRGVLSSGTNVLGQGWFRADNDLDLTSVVISGIAGSIGLKGTPTIYKFITEQVVAWNVETAGQVLNSGIQKSLGPEKKH